MKTTIQQTSPSSNEKHISLLREQLAAAKANANAELTMKRHLEETLEMMRKSKTSLSSRIEIQRYLSLCCNRLGAANAHEDNLTQRLVDALNR
jgi:hypothetical protein